MRISLTRKTLNIEFVGIKESFTNMIIFEASNEKGIFFSQPEWVRFRRSISGNKA